MDRFDLEEQIMQSWSTSDDLRIISESITDSAEDWSIDRISNVLNGLAILHDVKCQRAFETFEELVANEMIS